MKTAVVTGGSSNIGQGIAIVLSEQGYDVAITYNHGLEGALETKQQVEKNGQKCFIYQASLEKAEVSQQILDQAHRDLGHIDLMVCNAANGGARDSVLTVTPERIDELYNLNYRSYVLCAGAAARYMVKDQVEGNIVFITSSRGDRAYPDDFLYGGFKAGIKRATESMALDLSAYNIRVNCVAPGAIWPDTERLRERKKGPFVTESIPLHRVGDAREIGQAVAYIAGDSASYITGITLRIDGGLVLPGMLETGEKTVWVNEAWKEETYRKAMEMVQEKD